MVNKKEYCKEWRKNKIEKDPHYKEEMAKRSRDYYQNNKERCKQRYHKRANKLKQTIFQLLGNKCSNPNCLISNGCRDVRCLQIDHIHGGGVKEWKLMKTPEKYYKHILKKIQLGSKDYQLLCANCNWIKRFENNEFRC
jgi:hypothetical protein